MPISFNDLRAARGKARVVLKQARSGDKVDNKVPGRLKWCRWGGKEHSTRNISEICDSCWHNREAISMARKAKEAAGDSLGPTKIVITILGDSGGSVPQRILIPEDDKAKS
jgi:hypothetical protein